MAELIEVPFGVWTWVGPRNNVLGGGLDPYDTGQWGGKYLGMARRVSGRHIQCHSQSGSSDVVSGYQYYSNRFSQLMHIFLFIHSLSVSVFDC